MDELSYLASIANEELISLKELIFQKTTVPTEIWEQFGTSGFVLLTLGFRDDPTESDVREIKAAHIDFQKLCERCPSADPDCLLHFSAAYTSLLLAMNGGQGALAPDQRVRHLIFAAQSKMSALTAHALTAFIDHSKKKSEKLSDAGKAGAKLKHEKFEKLKKWVLIEARSKAGSDVDIARSLANKLPAHLVDITKNPERMIYETLRTKSVK